MARDSTSTMASCERTRRARGSGSSTLPSRARRCTPAYARYFTPPPTELVSVSTIEKFEDTTGAPASNGNGTPTVDAIICFDVGITQQVPPGFTVGIDSYYKKACDLIDEGQFGPAYLRNLQLQQGARLGHRIHQLLHPRQPLHLRQLRLLRRARHPGRCRGSSISRPMNLNTSTATISSWITIRPSRLVRRGLSMERIYFHLRRDLWQRTSHKDSQITGNLALYISSVDAGIIKRFELAKDGAIELRGAVVNLADHTIRFATGSGSESSPINMARGGPFTAESNGNSVLSGAGWRSEGGNHL